METSQEAKTQALKELSAKLQREYEEQLQEQQRKYRDEIEALQVQIYPNKQTLSQCLTVQLVLARTALHDNAKNALVYMCDFLKTYLQTHCKKATFVLYFTSSA